MRKYQCGQVDDRGPVCIDQSERTISADQTEWTNRIKLLGISEFGLVIVD